eukprot:tig00021571_g22360.t1
MRVHTWPDVAADAAEDEDWASGPRAKAPDSRSLSPDSSPRRQRDRRWPTAWAEIPAAFKEGNSSLFFGGEKPATYLMVDMQEYAKMEDEAEQVLREANGSDSASEPADSPLQIGPATPPEPAADAGAKPSANAGFFARQPSHAPYLFVDEAAAAAAETALVLLATSLAPAPPPNASKNRVLSEAPRRHEPPGKRAEDAARLADGLSDARLLGAPLFTSFGGRVRFRWMLAALRFSGYPHLARGVLQALVAALQAVPPAGWTPAAAEIVVDHAFALLLAGTAEAPRTAHDLFAIDWPTAARLLGRVQLLGGDLGSAPGALRPKVLLFSAMLYDRYDKREEAMGLYFEAWAELVKRQLTPGPLEAVLIPALADLHFAYMMANQGQHIADKAYVLEGAGAATRYSLYLVKHLEVASLRAKRDASRATAASREALALAESLGPDYGLLLGRILSVHAQNLQFSSRLHSAAATWVRTLRALMALGDPSFADLDFVPHQLVFAARKRISAQARSRILAVVARLVSKADPRGESPMAAHVHFHRGEHFVELGNPAQAREHYEAALRIYRGRFGDHFMEDNTRIRHIVEALREIHATAGGTDGASASAFRPGFLARLFSRSRAPPVAPAGDGPGPPLQLLSTPRAVTAELEPLERARDH